MENETAAVTGAYGYSGKYIARRLLQRGYRVRTLTNSLHRENPFGSMLEAYPFNFDDPELLTGSLKGVRVLYNTYWVRFNHRTFRHDEAVENTLRLFRAAGAAGVERIVHVSITNPSEESSLEYFRGKALIEKELGRSGISHAILRPTVLFGREDILINNIAWVLRRFPVFPLFGDGDYPIQPVYVDDLAGLAVELGERTGNRTVNAVGPETFTFRSLVRTISRLIGRRVFLVSAPPRLCYTLAQAVSCLTGDILVTREEIEGLMAGLLCVDTEPSGTTKLTDWVRENAGGLGVRYASELARRRNRLNAYAS